MSGILPDIDPIEYEALQDVTRGDIVATEVRLLEPPSGYSAPQTEPSARNLDDTPWYIFVGEVSDKLRWNAETDPSELFADETDRPPELHLASIHVTPTHLWTITADEITDDSQKVTEVPPLKSKSVDSAAGPRGCMLTYHPDHRTRLLVHEAHPAGSEIYYTPRHLGTVVEVIHGPIVDPEAVLPAGYDPPS